MEYVAENYVTFPLETAAQAMRAGELPPNAIVITFDDGYRDNLVTALPILSELSLTATVFLPTSVVGTNRLLWHDRVSRAVICSSASVLPGFGAQGTDLPLGGPVQRRRVVVDLLHYLRSLDDDQREARVTQLMNNLNYTDEDGDPGLMLNWADVREMQRRGFSIGSHTVSHPVLSRVSADRARAEIVQSKEIIERELGVPVQAFAYPSGRPGDFDAGIKRLVDEAGYTCAVTTISGVNKHRGGDPGLDLLELKRGGSWETDLPSFGIRLSLDRVLA
jgi:peptidoglycan/xylan/chitin deacetylase (PgdA/CDA1 family)